MIVAIHQPNYLPYYGCFHKIKHSDIFVFLDNVLYSKNTWINRNKIKSSMGTVWLTVPVERKNVLETRICDVKIANDKNWQKKHWKSLMYNYGKAKHFGKYSTFFKNIYSREWTYLSELNECLIRQISEFLNLKTKFIRASELGIHGTGTEHLIDICKKVGADTYFSGQGGKFYQDEKKFRLNSIKIMYQKFEHPIYKQLFGEFIPNLSIVDMLFNEGKFLTSGTNTSTPTLKT